MDDGFTATDKAEVGVRCSVRLLKGIGGVAVGVRQGLKRATVRLPLTSSRPIHATEDAIKTIGAAAVGGSSTGACQKYTLYWLGSDPKLPLHTIHWLESDPSRATTNISMSSISIAVEGGSISSPDLCCKADVASCTNSSCQFGPKHSYPSFP